METKLSIKNIITFMGAFIAFSIGSGFASGQEVMQYFASYGYQCVLTGLAFLAILVYTNCSCLMAGHRKKFDKGSDIFYYYCGPYLGKFFDYFATVLCAMSFVMMVAGASATLTQQFGWPTWTGAALLAGCACISTIFGLDAVVDVIGKIGPVLIVFIMGIAVITLAGDYQQVPEGAALLAAGETEVLQGGSNWLTSAMAYGGFALMWFPGFCANLATKHSIKELLWGAVLGQIVTVLTGVVLAFAFIANIQEVASSQVPSLILAEKIFPSIAVVFAVIIFLAIFSSACPLLWTTAVRFFKERSKPYKILTLCLTVAAILVALLLPFNILVNFLFMLNGYVGFIFVLCMIIKDVQLLVEKRRKKAQEQG